MASEAFTLVDSPDGPRASRLVDDYALMTSAPIADVDVQFQHALLREFPNHTLTAVPTSNVDFLEYAAHNQAVAELNTDEDAVIRWRGYLPPAHGEGPGQLGDVVFYARYRYAWNGINFILFVVGSPPSTVQYVLLRPDENETPASQSRTTDVLIRSAAEYLRNEAGRYIWVYDMYWTRSVDLWEQVQKTSWEDVILEESQKKALQSVATNFFDSREIYEKYGIPWKRGLIFHGPVGNGKTISSKALMHTLYERSPAIPTLYVKTAPYTFNIRDIFQQARRMAPCLLIMEDIETIVTFESRSYFFNEVDGLESNDGILMIASTNYLERLDPGLSKRPSRFDRKYLFPLPNAHERALYCAYWRTKISKQQSGIAFPHQLCKPMAALMKGFSFAYMQEAFIATMLELANEDGEEDDDDDDDDDNDNDNSSEDNYGGGSDSDSDKDSDTNPQNYKIYRVLVSQIAILREDMDSAPSSPSASASASASVPPRPPPPRGTRTGTRTGTNTVTATATMPFRARAAPAPAPLPMELQHQRQRQHQQHHLQHQHQLRAGAGAGTGPGAGAGAGSGTGTGPAPSANALRQRRLGLRRTHARGADDFDFDFDGDFDCDYAGAGAGAGAGTDDVDADSERMQQAGMFKYQKFAETAFEWTPA